MLRNFDFLSDFYIISKIFKNIFMKIPTKISEKIVTQNPYLKVLEKKFVDKSGETSSFLITAHNKEKTDATFILPLTKDNKIIYLKEYRY